MIKKNIDSEIVFHLLQVADELRRNGDFITQKAGITTQQWLIMLHLAKDPNIFYLQKNESSEQMLAKELAESFNISRAGITNIINVLMEKGLMIREEDAVDKRRKRLTLTPKGMEVLEKLEPLRIQANTHLLKEITAEEKTVLRKFLKSSLYLLNIHFRKQ